MTTTTTTVVKPMSTSKLIRNMENNVFDYKHLAIKKIVCQFDNGKTKTSFRANIQAEKDKEITLNLTKLNIPVGRLWLTPDSVKFINYLENNYSLDNYTYLSSLLGMNLDFETVNAILSNNVFSLRDQQGNSDNGEYESSIEQGMYVLQSVRNSKSDSPNAKTRDKRKVKSSRKLVEGAPIRQKLYVDPQTFKLRKMTLEDAANARSVDVDFSEFVQVGKQLYPGEISLHLQSPDNTMEMKIKLSNFSLDEEKGVRFKVPEKFTRVGHE
ncbi:MAG TPA: hypothetical protein DCL77_11675 [Prolixibacteraceae bacterium]|nr:hypothetical protein [Prolixibacteraceae bacterium]